jgi:alkylated DNA nucleotide flippase Atl1
MQDRSAGDTLSAMSAANPNVYRISLADPGGQVRTLDVPSDAFGTTEHGLVLGSTVVPWHRVLRYSREVTQQIDPSFRRHAEIRLWVDDGSAEGEVMNVRADRFDQTSYTVDVAVERALNVEAGLFHLTKLSIPWNRVLEYERLPVATEVPVATPARPD